MIDARADFPKPPASQPVHEQRGSRTPPSERARLLLLAWIARLSRHIMAWFAALRRRLSMLLMPGLLSTLVALIVLC